jgi:hypothetical protein
MDNKAQSDTNVNILMPTNDLYFELSEAGEMVKLQPIELVSESDNDWDRNWIRTKITLKSGGFSGQYEADIMTIDFEKFKQDLRLIYDNLNGSLVFEDLEDAIQLKIQGDGIGHFETKVTGRDGNYDRSLTFKMSFDQTQIKMLINQLDEITKRFPIQGNFEIKNI